MNDETSKSPEALIKNEKSSKSAEDLIISFKFLPMADVSYRCCSKLYKWASR